VSSLRKTAVLLCIAALLVAAVIPGAVVLVAAPLVLIGCVLAVPAAQPPRRTVHVRPSLVAMTIALHAPRASLAPARS
jgi:hypothetical protein